MASRLKRDATGGLIILDGAALGWIEAYPDLAGVEFDLLAVKVVEAKLVAKLFATPFARDDDAVLENIYIIFAFGGVVEMVSVGARDGGGTHGDDDVWRVLL